MCFPRASHLCLKWIMTIGDHYSWVRVTLGHGSHLRWGRRYQQKMGDTNWNSLSHFALRYMFRGLKYSLHGMFCCHRCLQDHYNEGLAQDCGKALDLLQLIKSIFMPNISHMPPHWACRDCALCDSFAETAGIGCTDHWLVSIYRSVAWPWFLKSPAEIACGHVKRCWIARS